MHTEYMGWAFTNRAKNLELARDFFKEKQISFDAFACRGVSGIVAAAGLSLIMDKGLIVVRKPGENSHTCTSLESSDLPPVFKYIFLDDFIATGETYLKVREVVAKAFPLSTCIGAFLYSNEIRFRPLERLPLP